MSICRKLFSFNTVNLFCLRGLATTPNSIISRLKRDIEKDILPPKPKKPLTSFLQYFMSIRSDLEKEYPNYAYQDIMKKASEQWAQVDPMTKQNMRKQFVEQHTIYKQKLMDYKNSITYDQKIIMETELIKKENALRKNQIKQKLTELGKPKRPLNAYHLFIQSKRDAKDSSMSQSTWMITMAKEWKDMSVDAKSKYVAEATKLIENYKIDMKNWEQNMIQAECPNRIKTQITDTESITVKCSDIKEKNNKIGWGTDIAHCIPRKISNVNNDQCYESIKNLISYKQNSQSLTKYNATKENVLKDDAVKPEMQVRDTYTQIYEYFNFLRKRFSTTLREMSRNWKMRHVQ
ncbi:hypothetical protein HN011_009212 [Eciton burchellii]|nr:hypothetical protein HN011_009212 [Eciton burchellii]